MAQVNLSAILFSIYGNTKLVCLVPCNRVPRVQTSMPTLVNTTFSQLTVRSYVTVLETSLVNACALCGVKAQTSLDTGVWVDDKKIAAIGMPRVFFTSLPHHNTYK